MTLRKFLQKMISVLALSTVLLVLPVQFVSANDHTTYNNLDSGYKAYIEDQADLLTDEEENQLLEVLKPITKYANVSFVSLSENFYKDTYNYAYHYYEETFGSTDGIVLVIDMDCREILIHSGEKMGKIITNDYANSITDNIYRYASSEDYLTCASKGFEQVLRLIEGRRIAQPMKYICNALLAMICALLLNYFLAKSSRTSSKTTAGEISTGLKSNFAFRNPNVILTNTTKIHSPRSSGSSGGSSHRSSGGGSHHSGGGHSGSHGSHRF